MRRHLLIGLTLLVSALALTSCSEDSGETPEFDNWQSRNDTYFKAVYDNAKGATLSGKWKIIPNWSLESFAVTKPEDNIVVEVLREGTGTGCPLYTDSVIVHYSGRLMPSASYADGYRFDGSYSGDLSLTTAKPAKFSVKGTVDGFCTALQNMHIGDHWRVYIPYQLGYGDSNSSLIPAYSTLVFELYLVAYYRPEATIPQWKVR